jgi:hypothetical protein
VDLAGRKDLAMTEKFFNAVSVEFGYCKKSECRAVHIHLLDQNGTPRAQAVIACENIEQFITDLREAADITLGRASVGNH